MRYNLALDNHCDCCGVAFDAVIKEYEKTLWTNTSLKTFYFCKRCKEDKHLEDMMHQAGKLG